MAQLFKMAAKIVDMLPNVMSVRIFFNAILLTDTTRLNEDRRPEKKNCQDETRLAFIPHK